MRGGAAPAASSWCTSLGASIAVASGVVAWRGGAPVRRRRSRWACWAAPLSVVWLVGVTNAFNLIDGLDGLSAGLALIASLCMAAVFGLVGQPIMAGAALVLAGALAGFLPFNLHPARLFLGDSGATAIGFCLGRLRAEGRFHAVVRVRGAGAGVHHGAAHRRHAHRHGAADDRPPRAPTEAACSSPIGITSTIGCWRSASTTDARC